LLEIGFGNDMLLSRTNASASYTTKPEASFIGY